MWGPPAVSGTTVRAGLSAGSPGLQLGVDLPQAQAEYLARQGRSALASVRELWLARCGDRVRYRSKLSGGLQVFAVAGTNTVSFGIHADKAARSGLLGFAVERVDPAKDERYYVHGFKVFPSILPQPDQNTYVTTYVHPIQSLVWDDFTAEPGHDYTYVFHPLAGTPKNLDRSRPSISIDIRTEPRYGETHDVFFNRGVASSQAYARKFGNFVAE
jgi:hypothetical protein